MRSRRNAQYGAPSYLGGGTQIQRKTFSQGYDPETQHVRPPPPRTSRIRRERFATPSDLRYPMERNGGNGEAYKAKRPWFTKDDCTVAIGNTSSGAGGACCETGQTIVRTLSVHQQTTHYRRRPTTRQWRRGCNKSRFASSAGGAVFYQKNGAAQIHPRLPPTPHSPGVGTGADLAQMRCSRDQIVKNVELNRCGGSSKPRGTNGSQYREDHAEPVALMTPILEREKRVTRRPQRKLLRTHTTLDRQYEVFCYPPLSTVS